MKKFLIILLYVCVSLNIAGQRNDVLENRFRNPIDTTTFHTRPTILLFVHSQCGNGHLCATTRMQKALEKDSLQIRKERAIKLYVVYPKCYDIQDINTNVKPVPKSGNSDLSIGICPMCGGSGNFRQT